jgi:hypothetical protein
LALSAGLSDKESLAAAWGTAAHECAEAMLAGKPVPDSVKTKEHVIEVDDEVLECAQVYVDYVLQQGDGCEVLIEQRFTLNSLGTPFDAGGTGDAVILNTEKGIIEIVDLKGGRGVVVEAEGNKQLRTYALGALLANPGPWHTVKVTIVQPRAPHPDGRIRSEEFDVTDLFDWTVDLLEAMARAKEAKSDPAQHLAAGAHCQFCKAAPTCPALSERALAEAHVHFKPEEGVMTVPPAPETMEMEKITRVLDAADMIQGWLNAVRAYAQDKAEAGHEVPGYVLVPKRAMRKWTDQIDVMDLVMATGKQPEEFFHEPKLMSPAQVEKVVGKKGYEAVKALVVQESSGYNLARADKTTRAKAITPGEAFFQIEGDK